MKTEQLLLYKQHPHTPRQWIALIVYLLLVRLDRYKGHYKVMRKHPFSGTHMRGHQGKYSFSFYMNRKGEAVGAIILFGYRLLVEKTEINKDWTLRMHSMKESRKEA